MSVRPIAPFTNFAALLLYIFQTSVMYTFGRSFSSTPTRDSCLLYPARDSFHLLYTPRRSISSHVLSIKFSPSFALQLHNPLELFLHSLAKRFSVVVSISLVLH